MGVGGHNLVLEAPRNGDMKGGVRKLLAETYPEVMHQLIQMRTPRFGVDRVTVYDPDIPPSYLYMVYARDRWEDKPDLYHYKRGMKMVKEDLRKMGETEFSTIRPPFTEETESMTEALNYLEDIFIDSGIRVNLFRDICRGNPTGIFEPDEESER